MRSRGRNGGHGISRSTPRIDPFKFPRYSVMKRNDMIVISAKGLRFTRRIPGGIRLLACAM